MLKAWAMIDSMYAVGAIAPLSYLHTITLDSCPRWCASWSCVMPIFSLSDFISAPRLIAKSRELWSAFFGIDQNGTSLSSSAPMMVIPALAEDCSFGFICSSM